MTTPQLSTTLQRIYSEENCRIVFWYDPDREFEDGLNDLPLDNVTILRPDRISPLEIKVRLELEDTTGKYLIYSPFSEPARAEDDWLTDIRLYSRTFRADRASIVLDELGLENHALSSHLKKYLTFFGNQERMNRLKKWIRPKDTEEDIDLKITAVLTRAEQPDVFGILMRLFAELADEKSRDALIPLPGPWHDIERFGLMGAFWQSIARVFGYVEKGPRLSDLLIRLLVTDFSNSLKGDCPSSLCHFLLPGQAFAGNVSVFLSQWRSNIGYYESYNISSHHIAKDLKIEEHIHDLDEYALMDVMTFEAVEQHIVRCLRDHLTGKGGVNLETLRDVINRRKDGYWASPLLNMSGKGNDYLATYKAIETAAELLVAGEKHLPGLSYTDAAAMYKAYRDELFRYDQLYRLFQECADQVELSGWDILKDLRGIVEGCYGWFIDQEALSWGNFVDPGPGEGLLHQWLIGDVKNQYDFYTTFVDPLLKNSVQGKVYVVISDAFRYEAAEELSKEINGKYRLRAALESQLSVLPSYTGLGMAALLPHTSIDFKQNATLDVTIDGQPTGSIEQRSKILSSVQGTAIKAEDLMAMNKDQGRVFVKPWRVIYVYHNQVDAAGDSASTESKTFTAVRQAIKDISSLTSFIINNLNGSNVVITADHGFLFQEKIPGDADKSGLTEKPAGTLKAKKRYLLGTNLGDGPKVWHGNTKTTAKTDGTLEFWIPMGANRFHFSGGARYIHGGAMLQEIVVPVVTVKELTGKAREKSVISKVGVSILGSLRKVVNNIQQFEFIQTDAVSERMLPRTLSVSLRDGDELISNEVVLTFDSQSAAMEDRKKTAKLVIKTGQYDKKHEYKLVLRDGETKIEYMGIPMTIDLTFTNDF